MDYESNTERMIAESISPPEISRDHVRQWVVETRRQTGQQRLRRKWLATVLFVGIGLGMAVSIDQRMRSIRQMVVKSPSPSVVLLTELTQELCNEDPAEYFLNQLENRKSRPRIDMAIAINQ